MHGPGLQEDYLGLCSPRFGPALGRFSPPAHRFCQNPEGTLEATPGIALFNSLLGGLQHSGGPAEGVAVDGCWLKVRHACPADGTDVGQLIEYPVVDGIWESS